MAKEQFIEIESSLNFPLSVEEMYLLELMEKDDSLSKDLVILIKGLIEVGIRGPKEREVRIIQQTVRQLGLATVEVLPNHIHRRGKSYIARRMLKGKRVMVKQSMNLNEVIKALNDFNKKHKLK